MKQDNGPGASGPAKGLEAALRGSAGTLRALWRDTHVIPALLASAFLLTALAALMEERDNIFTVEARTESLSLVTSDEVLSQWSVGGGRLMSDPLSSSGEVILLPEDTYLNISSGTQVTVQRHGIQALRIRLQNSTGSVGTLDTSESVPPRLESWAVVVIEPELTPLILPFRGVLTVGDDVTSQVDSIFLSGSISVLEEQWVGNARYVAGNTVLDRGDRIRFWDETDGRNTEAIVEGFVRVEPANQARFSEAENAMQLIAHGAASYVKVERLGSTGYEVYAHRWARFLYDPFLAFLAAFGAVLFAVLEVYTKCREMLMHRGERHG